MEVLIWDPVERFFWGILFAILIMCAVLYFLRGKKNENFNEKIMMYGFASLFVGFAFGFFFSYLRQFLIPGTYVNFALYGDYDKVGSDYKTMSKISYVCSPLGFTFFLLAFEISVKRTKYILTTTSIILVIIIIILPYDEARFVNNAIYFTFSLVLLIVILFKFTKWSRLEFKAIPSFLLLGIALMQVGRAFHSQDVKNLNIVPLCLIPLLIILGSFIAILPLIISPKYFSRALTLWKLNGIIVISLIFFMTSFYIFFLGFQTLYSVIVTIIGLVFVYLFYRINNIIKNEIVSEKQPDLLEMFTKPQKVTEEEVSISKEKKICLVCKGKVFGYNVFICSECETFYCEKCAHALENLENACWFCNEPIDKSKPSKPFEKEEELDLEILDKKQ